MVAGGPAPDHGDMPLRTPGLPMQAGAMRPISHPTAPEARMNSLLNHFCRKAPLPQPVPAALAMPSTAATETKARPAAAAAEAGACGWFDSSLDLHQGLLVSELRETDWTVLVLWFGPAALRGPARLQ